MSNRRTPLYDLATAAMIGGIWIFCVIGPADARTHEQALVDLASVDFPQAKAATCFCDNRRRAICIYTDRAGREAYRKVMGPKRCERRAPGEVLEHRQ